MKSSYFTFHILFLGSPPPLNFIECDILTQFKWDPFGYASFSFSFLFSLLVKSFEDDNTTPLHS